MEPIKSKTILMQKIKKENIISKRLIKCVASFDYFGKTLFYLQQVEKYLFLALLEFL